MKKTILFLLWSLLSGVAVWAQDTGTSSNVDIFFLACDNRAVIDFSGVMQANYDLYYQVFNAAGGTGTALTGLRRVSVAGDYTVSQVINYDGGATVGFGAVASVKVSIARETDSSRELFSTTVDDGQDGCGEPSFPSVDSTASDAPLTTDPVEEAIANGIFSPDGGRLSPPLFRERPDEPIVVIGPRQSDIDRFENGRTNKPGLIFAECDNSANTDPGLIYDTDTLTVFWSWFAKTAAQVRDHIANAEYSITLNGQPFPVVNTSPVVQREDGNFWVFYTVNLGDKWRPGDYGIQFKLNWKQQISDGFDTFGPDTAIPFIESSCTFRVRSNPYGVVVLHENPKVPLESR